MDKIVGAFLRMRILLSVLPWLLAYFIRSFSFFREVREELLKIAREQATRKTSLSLIDEGVLNELRDLAWDVLEEEKAERDAKLQLLAGQLMKRRTARYFQR